MQFKKKLNNLNNLYIVFFSTVLFINIFITTTLNANLFKINDLEISEPFELNFSKEKVIEKGFKQAFIQLISMITTSNDKKKIENTSLATIKMLVDSFTMSNERFINNEYHSRFDVNFNKKNTLKFFEKKNIFPSIPKKKDLLLIPILVDLQLGKIFLFNNNVFYKQWNSNNKKYFLLHYILPSEDLDDVEILSQNSKSIEDYDFKEIIAKYDINDFIVAIIYKNKGELRVLSKIKLNQLSKIDNQKFENIDLANTENVNLIFNNLKNIYENYWKKINQINTSIKLPLTVSINSNLFEKINIFENNLREMDLVSHFNIQRFDNQNIFFKIIFNGSPDKFLSEMKEKDILINTQNQIWNVK